MPEHENDSLDARPSGEGSTIRPEERESSQQPSGEPTARTPEADSRPQPAEKDLGLTGDGASQNNVFRVRHDLRKEEHLQGQRPGDRLIRYSRSSRAFRRGPGGVMMAEPESDAPRSAVGRLFNRVKRILIGAPISTE